MSPMAENCSFPAFGSLWGRIICSWADNEETLALGELGVQLFIEEDGFKRKMQGKHFDEQNRFLRWPHPCGTHG